MKYISKNIILLLTLALAFVLRFYHLGANPPSLYWDEVSLGYNAYSVLKTGADEHGKSLPLTSFAAFGDYKPPLYIYAAVPSIAIFDLTPFAVRFPSALFGFLTVVVTYYFAKKIFDSQKIALLAAFLLAISPWHLQFSRAAFEANLAVFFSFAAIYLFTKIKEKKFFVFFSLASFLAAMYTFTGQRLFVPFILLALLWQFRKEVKKNYLITFSSLLIFLLFLLPLLNFSLTTIEGKLRFNEVTIFKDLKPINESIKDRSRDNFSTFSSIIHNRRIYFAYEYLQNYFDAFNPSFLFFKGDVNPRLSIQNAGELYYFELPLILLGVFLLVKTRQPFTFLILAWLLISPIGQATARETPHALRMAHILPVFQLVSAYGLIQSLKMFKFGGFKIIFYALASLFLFYCVFNYLHHYYIHYPKEYSGEWQYGYKEAVTIAADNYNNVDHILVSNHQGRAYIYFLFFNKINPREYLQNSQIVRDQFYFFNVYGFDKYEFFDTSPASELTGKNLLIFAPNTLPADAQKLKTITNLNGFPIYDVGIMNK